MIRTIVRNRFARIIWKACNALLSGATAATFDKLQRAQNNLASRLHRRQAAASLATLASGEAAGHL